MLKLPDKPARQFDREIEIVANYADSKGLTVLANEIRHLRMHRDKVKPQIATIDKGQNVQNP